MSAAGAAETRRAGAARVPGGRLAGNDTLRICKEAGMSAAGAAETRRAGAARVPGGRLAGNDTLRICKEAES